MTSFCYHSDDCAFQAVLSNHRGDVTFLRSATCINNADLAVKTEAYTVFSCNNLHVHLMRLESISLRSAFNVFSCLFSNRPTHSKRKDLSFSSAYKNLNSNVLDRIYDA